MEERFYGLALIFTGICVIVYLLTLALPGIVEPLLLVSGQVAERPWTLVTHIFLHTSFTHLYFNLFALALFGSILEKYIGSRNFLIVFFSTGIASSIADIIFYPATLGASGAIFGLLGALAIIRPRQVVWALGVPMYIIVAAFVWIVLDFTGMFYPDNVAHAAHLFGMGSGMVIGFKLREKYKEPPKPREGEETEVISEKELEEWEERHMVK